MNLMRKAFEDAFEKNGDFSPLLVNLYDKAKEQFKGFDTENELEVLEEYKNESLSQITEKYKKRLINYLETEDSFFERFAEELAHSNAFTPEDFFIKNKFSKIVSDRKRWMHEAINFIINGLEKLEPSSLKISNVKIHVSKQKTKTSKPRNRKEKFFDSSEVIELIAEQKLNFSNKIVKQINNLDSVSCNKLYNSLKNGTQWKILNDKYKTKVLIFSKSNGDYRLVVRNDKIIDILNHDDYNRKYSKRRV